MSYTYTKLDVDWFKIGLSFSSLAGWISKLLDWFARGFITNDHFSENIIAPNVWLYLVLTLQSLIVRTFAHFFTFFFVK